MHVCKHTNSARCTSGTEEVSTAEELPVLGETEAGTAVWTEEVSTADELPVLGETEAGTAVWTEAP